MKGILAERMMNKLNVTSNLHGINFLPHDKVNGSKYYCCPESVVLSVRQSFNNIDIQCLICGINTLFSHP
jgi:hypothetical protein